MFLGYNAKYYFDKNNKIILSYNLYDEIYSAAINNLYTTKVIYNKTFKIIRENFLTIENDKGEKTELTYNPKNIIFIGKEKKEQIKIYSLEQFQKALDFFQISFPYSQGIT